MIQHSSGIGPTDWSLIDYLLFNLPRCGHCLEKVVENTRLLGNLGFLLVIGTSPSHANGIICHREEKKKKSISHWRFWSEWKSLLKVMHANPWVVFDLCKGQTLLMGQHENQRPPKSIKNQLSACHVHGHYLHQGRWSSWKKVLRDILTWYICTYKLCCCAAATCICEKLHWESIHLMQPQLLKACHC